MERSEAGILAEPRAAQTVVDRTFAEFGRIDALLNVAGAVPQVDLFETTGAQFPVSPGARWMTGSVLRMNSGEVKSI